MRVEISKSGQVHTTRRHCLDTAGALHDQGSDDNLAGPCVCTTWHSLSEQQICERANCHVALPTAKVVATCHGAMMNEARHQDQTAAPLDHSTSQPQMRHKLTSWAIKFGDKFSLNIVRPNTHTQPLARWHRVGANLSHCKLS